MALLHLKAVPTKLNRFGVTKEVLRTLFTAYPNSKPILDELGGTEGICRALYTNPIDGLPFEEEATGYAERIEAYVHHNGVS